MREPAPAPARFKLFSMASTILTRLRRLLSRDYRFPTLAHRALLLPPTVSGGVFMLALALSPGLAPAGDLRTAGATVDVAAAPFAPVPVELQRLVKLGETAANTKRPAALATLAAALPAKAFDWVTYSSETWQCDVLVLPQPGNSQAAGLTDRHATRLADFPGGDRRNEERLHRRQSADTHAAPYLAVFHAWHTCEGEGDHVYRLIHTGKGWKLGEEIPESDPGAFRIRDHNLNVRIDVPGKKATISDDFRVERTDPAVPEYGLFRISQDFQIHRLLQTGSSETPVVFHQVGGVVAFVPPQASTFTLRCAYASTLTHSMSDYIKADEAVIVSYWYPHIARLPATTTVTAIAPPGWIALAQGEAVRKEPQSDGSTLSIYRNDIPNSFFTLDMGRYKVTNRLVKGANAFGVSTQARRRDRPGMPGHNRARDRILQRAIWRFPLFSLWRRGNTGRFSGRFGSLLLCDIRATYTSGADPA